MIYDFSFGRYTNDDGRCLGLISVGQLKPGTYKMFFDTGMYFASQGNSKPFYPYVEVSPCTVHIPQFMG